MPRAISMLSSEYTIQKFYQLSGYPKYNRSARTYYGGCPICREGKSWGKKRRLYFITDKEYLFCHNCGWSGNPVKFIQEVSGLTFNEILEESKEYNILPTDISLNSNPELTRKPTSTLPRDSINLFDNQQLQYYTDNDIVNSAMKYIKQRKLDIAINKPKTFWLSLSDFTHKNRLVIPFYNLTDTIVFYQTRSLDKTDTRPKYLSKINSDKTLFNINNVSPQLNKIFIFEGPIDACFIKNGVAMAGLNENSQTTLTPSQQAQLNFYKLHEKIWVLDSQWKDSASRTKSKILLEMGEKVFIWPEDYGKRFKDFNEMALSLDIPDIPISFIENNTYSGLKGKIIIGQIN